MTTFVKTLGSFVLVAALSACGGGGSPSGDGTAAEAVPVIGGANGGPATSSGTAAGPVVGSPVVPATGPTPGPAAGGTLEPLAARAPGRVVDESTDVPSSGTVTATDIGATAVPIEPLPGSADGGAGGEALGETFAVTLTSIDVRRRSTAERVPIELVGVGSGELRVVLSAHD